MGCWGTNFITTVIVVLGRTTPEVFSSLNTLSLQSSMNCNENYSHWTRLIHVYTCQLSTFMWDSTDLKQSKRQIPTWFVVWNIWKYETLDSVNFLQHNTSNTCTKIKSFDTGFIHDFCVQKKKKWLWTKLCFNLLRREGLRAYIHVYMYIYALIYIVLHFLK